MPIYIIQPKTTSFLQSLNLAAIKLNAESRQQQVDNFIRLQQEEDSYQQVSSWTEDVTGKEGINIIKSAKQPGITGTTVVEMSSEEAAEATKDLAEVADILRGDREIQLIHPVKQDKASFKTEGELEEKDLWHLEAIKTEATRLKGLEATGKDVTIAVLDTGIDSTHPALNGKIRAAYTFDPQQWSVQPQTPSLDTEGHGTHVAGLICGKKIGVAPAAQLVSGVLIPGGQNMLPNFVLAIDWLATQLDIKIVNISAGIRGYLPDWEKLIEDLLYIGILPICAIGNEGRDVTRSPGNYRSVVSVGASNNKNRVAGFSSSGTLTVDNHIYTVPDLVAPGEQIYSAVVRGGYEAWDGTSMATPIVSSIAALILERNPNISVLELKNELLYLCQDLGEDRDRQGKGLIQI